MTCPVCECVFLFSVSPAAPLYGQLRNPDARINCPACGLIGHPVENFGSVSFKTWGEGIAWFCEQIERQNEGWTRQ